jgi:hypothetical protein
MLFITLRPLLAFGQHVCSVGGGGGGLVMLDGVVLSCAAEEIAKEASGRVFVGYWCEPRDGSQMP